MPSTLATSIRSTQEGFRTYLIMLADLWPGLDLRHLAAFEAVARLRSFARVAQELGYTQPAVSQQVAALERIVGQRLVERSSGRAEAGGPGSRGGAGGGARRLFARVPRGRGGPGP